MDFVVLFVMQTFGILYTRILSRLISLGDAAE
jgi:hypothetical protein